MVEEAKSTTRVAYGAAAIEVLEGLAAVRRRPGMFIQDPGKAGITQLIKEVLDNSLDEFQAGCASAIDIAVDSIDRRATITDNGRGIPVEKHPTTGYSTLTTVVTQLHAGGKFGGGAYKYSAGLHGVGISVVNALASYFRVRVRRDGKNYEQIFEKGVAKTAEPLESDTAEQGTGTLVEFVADPLIFPLDETFDLDQVQDWVYALEYLCPTLKVKYQYRYLDEEGVEQKGVYETSPKTTFGAIVTDDLSDWKPTHPILTFEATSAQTGRIQVALQWTTGSGGDSWYSYVNLTPVPEGGTHVTGIRRAVTKAIKDRTTETNYYTDDLREGLSAAVHLEIEEPVFQGQTKQKLLNKEAETACYNATLPVIQTFFDANPELVEAIVHRAVQIRVAKESFKKKRQQAAEEVAAAPKRTRGILPGKLIEAPDADPWDRELFLVEGDSASGSGKMARDPSYQEILPLKGKVPNAMRREGDGALANVELLAISTSIGTGFDEACDPDQARVGKVLLLMDSDPDGQHITALVLAFLAKHMRPLFDAEMVYVVVSPLYVATKGSKRAYGSSLNDLVLKGVNLSTWRVSRLKGHGEASAEELREYAMDPASRKLLRIELWGDLEYGAVEELMGSDTTLRRELLDLE